MRGSIVVSDDLHTTLSFVPQFGACVVNLDDARYLKARSPDGITVARAFKGMCHQLEWSCAVLSRRVAPVHSTTLPSRKVAYAALIREVKQLEAILHRANASFWKQYLPIRSTDGPDILALRADCVHDWTAVRLQVYQYHIRRAFYSFDRESGILFPGGSRHWVKLHDESFLSILFPLWPKAKRARQ
ncbi:MAG TPA: hypothetical protein VD971_07085 [Phycisphaerales bacterium]|nr:hypothetical protein [Phycisphaerales bacterium]